MRFEALSQIKLDGLLVFSCCAMRVPNCSFFGINNRQTDVLSLLQRVLLVKQTERSVLIRKVIAVLQDFHDLKAISYDVIRRHNPSKNHRYQ